jgi:hypothetical protein
VRGEGSRGCFGGYGPPWVRALCTVLQAALISTYHRSRAEQDVEDVGRADEYYVEMQDDEA